MALRSLENRENRGSLENRGSTRVSRKSSQKLQIGNENMSRKPTRIIKKYASLRSRPRLRGGYKVSLK